jgi:hypothetical protein
MQSYGLISTPKKCESKTILWVHLSPSPPRIHPTRAFTPSRPPTSRRFLSPITAPPSAVHRARPPPKPPPAQADQIRRPPETAGAGQLREGHGALLPRPAARPLATPRDEQAPPISSPSATAVYLAAASPSPSLETPFTGHRPMSPAAASSAPHPAPARSSHTTSSAPSR